MIKRIIAFILTAVLLSLPIALTGCITVTPKDAAPTEAPATPEPEPTPEPEATPEPTNTDTQNTGDTSGDYGVSVIGKNYGESDGDTLLLFDLEFKNGSEYELWSGAVAIKMLQDGEELEGRVTPEDEEIGPGSKTLYICSFTAKNPDSDVTLRVALSDQVMFEERYPFSGLEYMEIEDEPPTGVDVGKSASGEATWPKSWPSEIPKPDGVVTGVYGDDLNSELGIFVTLNVQGMDAAKAYVDTLVSLGYKKGAVITYSGYNVDLTGKGYVIGVCYITADEMCNVSIAKQ